MIIPALRVFEESNLVGTSKSVNQITFVEEGEEIMYVCVCVFNSREFLRDLAEMKKKRKNESASCTRRVCVTQTKRKYFMNVVSRPVLCKFPGTDGFGML